ncbi:MAG: antitoxin VapB family protein [Gemmatimonadota bacterium]
MATKTISLRLEAYERLRRARRHPTESFSDVVMRAQWTDAPSTAGEYLAHLRERGPLYDLTGVKVIEELCLTDRPARDKWSTK